MAVTDFGASARREVPAYVKLISDDEEPHTFYVEKRCAMVSNTIKTALTGEFKEKDGEVKLPISAAILERIIQYFHYKLKYSNSRVPPPEFRVAPEMALDLLMAANYLDC